MSFVSFQKDISGNEPSPLIKLLWRGDDFIFLKRGIDGFSTDGKHDRHLFAECVCISETCFMEQQA